MIRNPVSYACRHRVPENGYGHVPGYLRTFIQADLSFNPSENAYVSMRERITDEDTINRFSKFVESDVNEKGCDKFTSSPDSFGYRMFWFGGQARSAHRISYRIHCGPIPEDKQVNHECDTPWCVNPNHLYLGTQSENNRDAWARNRRSGTPGVKRPDYLDEWEVAAVHRLKALNVKQKLISDVLGISEVQTSDIVNGKTYTSVDVEEYIDEHLEPIPIRFASIHNQDVETTI